MELDGDELHGRVDQIVSDLQQDGQIVVRFAPRGCGQNQVRERSQT